MLEKVDQRILGGMKIQIGDTVYDGTLQNSLNQLQTALLKINRHDHQKSHNRKSEKGNRELRKEREDGACRHRARSV